MKKKRAYIPLCLTVFIATALFINPGIAASSQAAVAIPSSGTINFTNESSSFSVIVRHLGNPMPDWTKDIPRNVATWVTAYPWIKGGAVIIDVEDIAPILWFNQNGYNGYIFNITYGTWSGCGWTFNQLKSIIDTFHTYNVSVVIGITAICKDSTSGWNSNIYQWIAKEHPELAFSHPDGSLYLKAQEGNSAPLNWFANFTSNDSVSGAKKGESVVELFNARLTEMIHAGLEWDGFFGSEGFGSVGVWGGNYATNATFIDASNQSINKWANWTTITLPSNWNTLTNAQRVQWVMKNATMNYQEFAGYMYASNLFAPIHDTIRNTRQSSGFFVGLIFSPDETWQDGKRNSNWCGWSPEVGYNATYLAQYCSDDTYIYFVNQEGTDWASSMAQVEAYTASSVKSSSAKFNVVVGIHTLNNNDDPAPLSWLCKEYLAETCCYVWIGGQRIACTNPKTIVIQYPENTPTIGDFHPEINTFFEWVNNIQKALSVAQPEYLGPTYVFTSLRQTYQDVAWSSLNYTMLQWVETDDLLDKPQNLNWQMNTLFLPQAAIWYNGGGISNIQDQLLYAFANGSLSIIVDSETNYMDAGILQNELFNGPAVTNPLSTFHVTGPSTWQADNQTQILSQTDAAAKWITGNYVGNSYTVAKNKWFSSQQAFCLRGYYSANGFIPIGQFTTSNLIQYGIYYNTSSGNFIYGQEFQMLPSDMLNRGIQWATKTPIISDNSLIETAMFTVPGGIAVPMWNMQDDKTVTVTLNVNATQLGLKPISAYTFSWASNPSKAWTETAWSNLGQITLEKGADILLIKAA